LALIACGFLCGASSEALVESAAAGVPEAAGAIPREAEAVEDRYSRVFDALGDANLLTARFLKLSFESVPKSSDKTGDATILKSPDGKVMLIDAGVPDSGAQVVRALKALRVGKIDIVILSHPHIDHIGGISAVFEEFPVGIVYSSKLTHGTKTYEACMSAISKQGIKVEYLEEGSEFMFGEAVKAKVFNPERDIKYYDGYPANGTTFMNERSLVVRLSFGKSSLLFPGDIYVSRETELMKKFGDQLKTDVLKIGHHGMNTSSTASFIKTVSPKIAVMMNDSFTSQTVYDNYRDAGAEVFSTFLDGSVKVSADAEGNYETLTQFDRKGNP
jgi:competence protein ComEC